MRYSLCLKVLHFFGDVYNNFSKLNGAQTFPIKVANVSIIMIMFIHIFVYFD